MSGQEREGLIVAATSCPHTIDRDSVVLRFDPKQPGHNALNQLARRLEAARAAQPAARSEQQVIAAFLERTGHEHGPLTHEMRDFIEGMSVSVDVSMGEPDAGRRYFGTITEVMDDPHDKHGVTLLVQDAKPNFDVQTPFAWVLRFDDPDPQFDIEYTQECPVAWVGKATPVYEGPCERNISLQLRASEAERRLAAAEPVAFVRRHPSGELSAEYLHANCIEEVRKRSGAWVPLYTAPQPAAQPAADGVKGYAMALNETAIALRQRYAADMASTPLWAEFEKRRNRLARSIAEPAPQPAAGAVTTDEFFAEAKRLGLRAADIAPQLASRPEFADCLTAAPAVQLTPDERRVMRDALHKSVQVLHRPAAPAVPQGWVFNHAQQSSAGIWEIGYRDDEDDRFSPIVTVDTGLYYQPQDAEPLAKAILAMLSAAPQAPAGGQWTSVEEICQAIKAADDEASTRDYMLDSDDCISVIRGTWNPHGITAAPDGGEKGAA